MLDLAKWESVQILVLAPIKRTLKARKGWFWTLRHNVDRLENEYRQFLYLIAAHPGEVVVPWSEAMDEFWHEHILDTRKYEADCHAVFGRTIHHNPHLTKGSKPQVAAFQATKQMYRAAFGNPTRRVVGTDSHGVDAFGPILFAGSDSCGHSDSGPCGDGGSNCGASCGASCGGGGCGGGGCGGG